MARLQETHLLNTRLILTTKNEVFLTEDKLQAFTTKLNNPDLELARELFVFGYWTGN